jgi:3-phosphoshikimate 1-carboxyvinyltransferase
MQPSSELASQAMQPSSELAIEPVTEPIAATVQPPGSKSLTNRALVLAALGSTGEPITLTGALRSEDTEVMVESLRRLGFAAAFADATTITVSRPAGSARIPAPHAELDVANSGTSMRFLTALVSLGVGSYRLDGVPRMRQRPIADLLTALEQLGVEARSEAGTGCPPVIVRGSGDWPGQRRIAVGGAVSSQFLSALMLSAPFVSGQTWFLPDQQAVSRSYVEMTRAVLRQWGLTVTASPEEGYCIPGGQTTPCRHYAIEPDASAASYFFAAAAITGGQVRVPGLSRQSLQGDVRFVDCLQQMGCTVTWHADAITVQGPERLRGVDVDLNDLSDTAMTLAVVALFAEGPTTIRNVAHIRHKETDRLAALACELSKLGGRVEQRADGLTIEPPARLRPARISTYDDHRMAMSFALAGLRADGVVIEDPACVGKTYPGYWDDLASVCGRGGVSRSAG